MLHTRLAAADDDLWLARNGLVVDLFAGGGGASVALEKALGRPVSIALNHDPLAVALHGVNHPKTRHVLQDIFAADPTEITKGRPVYMLWASPSCTQHSRASRARPAELQLREMGWKVIDWIEQTRPLIVGLENVGEFQSWGPLLPNGFPDPKRKGETWRRFVQAFRDLGYAIEWRMIKASDFGAPTTRERLFVIARRDGRPIVWPAPTHGRNGLPYARSCDNIDWSIEAPSIFDRKRDLAEATIIRILKGIQRYIVEDPNPYQAPPQARILGRDRPEIVASFMAQNNTDVIGRRMTDPVSTFTAKCSQQSVVLAYLDKLRNNATGIDMRTPIHTLCAQGDHFAEVRLKTRAFGVKYYSEGGQLQDLREPLGTITTKDRFAIVMVRGEPHVITDIGYRFLTPRELWNLQGFDPDYKIDLIANGKPLAATHQKRMVGNSVSPPPATALLRANMLPVDDEDYALAA